MTEPRAEVWNEDCITGMASRLEEGSVHLIVTSIPFEELFTYSGKTEDVGNNGSTIDIRAGRFALNMRFVAEQMYRVLATGCNACIHIQQLLAYKNQHGFMGRRDFRGAMIDVFGAAGFHWTGEFAIAKNPQSMAQRLNLHSLQFKTGYARGAQKLAPAPNDYVLIFQKPGDALVPVRPIRHATNPGGWITSEDWIRDAHGIWTDILEIDILDGTRNRGLKENTHEKHVCPLQLEVIRRCIQLYTNPLSLQADSTVLDPFMGIGSVAWAALGARSPVTKLQLAEPRHVVGFELKESYHRACLDNIVRARASVAQRSKDAAVPDLFSSLESAPPSEDCSLAACDAEP